MIDTRLMLGKPADILTVQQTGDKLPYPLRLGTIRWTIEICNLSALGFHFSILVDLGKKLFDEYRTTDLNSKDGGKLMDLRGDSYVLRSMRSTRDGT
jgi:hypothetical protein